MACKNMGCPLVQFAILSLMLWCIRVKALFKLSGNPPNVAVGDNVTIALACTVDDDFKFVRWRQSNISTNIPIAIVKNNCTVISEDSFGTSNGYNYSCDLVKKEYFLSIAVTNLSETRDMLSWQCSPFIGVGSNVWSTAVVVPVKNLAITPVGINSVVSITEGDSLAFTCTTDSGRPAAWIQWYVGEQNVTNQAITLITAVGTKFISSSTLVYTGKDADHNKSIYCGAYNIDERKMVKSAEKVLNLQILVTVLTFTPTGINDVVRVESEKTLDFTCTAKRSRPAAWIQWYIGSLNITNDAVPQPALQDGTKFVSFSKLTYTGKVDDNNKTVHCEAENIERRSKAKSTNKILLIGFRPDRVIDLKAVCDGVSMVVMWRSESNGGSEQTFRVVRQNLHSNLLTRSDYLSDPGVGNIVQYTTKQLSPKSYYKIYIESNNAYGTVTSQEQVYCNTSGIENDALQTKESTLSFSSGFGLGTVLIIVINIVTIMTVFLMKKRRRSFADRSNAYEQSKVKAGDANVYNELNEIPRERRNQTDFSSETTYEEICNDTNQTPNADDKRKRRGKNRKDKLVERRT